MGIVETSNILWVAKMKVPAAGLRGINRIMYNLKRRSSCPCQFSVIKISFT